MSEAFERVDIVESDGLCVGFLDTASAPRCHLPRQYAVLNAKQRGFSLSELIRGLGMLDISLLSNMPNKGLWSMALIRFWHPRTNLLAFSSDHATARVSPSVCE